MINLNVKNCSLLIVLFIVSSIVFQSCKEKGNDLFNTEITLLEQINQKLEYKDRAEFYMLNPDVAIDINFEDFAKVDESIQKAIFDEMTIEKRLLFWKNKLEKDLSNNVISEEVRVLINKFISEMTVDLMESETYFTNFTALVDELKVQEQNYFTSFSSVDKDITYKNFNASATTVIGASQDPPCVAKFCISCATWPGRYKCTSKCKGSKTGCGIFWAYSCNYNCIKM